MCMILFMPLTMVEGQDISWQNYQKQLLLDGKIIRQKTVTTQDKSN